MGQVIAWKVLDNMHVSGDNMSSVILSINKIWENDIGIGNRYEPKKIQFFWKNGLSKDFKLFATININNIKLNY